MGTQILRPQDCLIEKIRDSPCRRRNYNGSSPSGFNPNSYNSNQRSHRKPTVWTERKRQSEPSVSKRSNSVDDLRASKSHRYQHHHNHRNGNDHQSFLMEKVTILRRGTSLDSKITSRETASAASKSEGGSEMVVIGTDRLGPDPEMVPKQVKIVDLRSPVTGKSDIYAGSAFAVSPAPSSLPLPSFSKKKHLSFDDLATRDLRRLLQLDF